MEKRRISEVLIKDLKKKMVFLAGPRQCGKTTLTELVADEVNLSARYYNWDIAKDRKLVLNGELDESSTIWILDELHKFRGWRNYLKGLFDEHRHKHHILVTGSAKLETYSRGGDSLQGRYYLHHLHPFTLGELLNPSSKPTAESIFNVSENYTKKAAQTLDDLLNLGGFPEPFLSGSALEARRWRLSYGTRIIRDEIRSLEQIKDLDRMELLFDRLPQVVGSVLSINALREDLEVAFETVRNWIAIFERLYGVFRIAPFGAPRIRAVKKEQKLYFWDWSRVENPASRLENLVAVHLLRFVHWQQDVLGEKWELNYFRNKQGQEVDFILSHQNKIQAAIEVKLDDRPLDSNLKYFIERIKTPYAFQISMGKKDFRPPSINGCTIRVLPAAQFLAGFY